MDLIDMTSDDGSQTIVPSGTSTPITPDELPGPTFLPWGNMQNEISELEVRVRALELQSELNALSEDTATCEQDSNRSNKVTKSDVAREFDLSIIFNERVVIAFLVFVLWLCIGRKYIYAETFLLPG
jgi:hypothetical protein